ncbi:hypothetical protein IGI65_001959 [Enterococcus sp. DIV0755b]|uniref:MSCRAMM family protein n=1 Tax=Enterococcus sp. DIV0755b TaxID=2774657 RepID=UPI003F21BE60
MNKRKKIIVVIAVLAILLPILEGLLSMSSLWRTSANEPTSTEIINTDFLKVNYTAQNDTEKGTTSWLVNYDYDLSKSTGNELNGEFEKVKLKFNLTNGSAIQASDAGLQLAENEFQNGEDGWIIQSAFSDKAKGSFKYTASTGTQPQLAFQMDGEKPLVIDTISSGVTSESQEKEATSVSEESEIIPNILADSLTKKHTLESSPATEEIKQSAETEQTTKQNQSKAKSMLQANTPIAGEDLIISQESIVDKITVISKAASEANVSTDYQPKIYHKDNNVAHTGDYSSAAEAVKTNVTYKNFTQGAAGTTIAYGYDVDNNPFYNAIKDSKTAPLQFLQGEKWVNEELTLIYQNVGAYKSIDGKYHQVGAVINLTNIIIGGTASSWTAKDGIPWMEFSHNLFSGVIYGNIHKFDIEFNFFDTATFPEINENSVPNQFIDFSESSKATMTFASLNGYGDINLHFSGTAKNAHEFAGKLDGNPNEATAGNTLKYHGNGSCSYDKQSYYSDGENKFDDYLGGASFATAAVTFPMSGTSHKYKFGSTQGRAWNTFASSSLAQVEQNEPTKTVQPLKQYKKGDTWDNPTGEESGYEQRYYNDLDRYNDGDDPWSLPEEYRVKGHDADKASELTSGVPTKESRFVKTGQEHYYFINQETIDVSSKSLVVPSQYIIEDTLPAGVELSESNWLDSITLYNVDGSTKFQTKEMNESTWNYEYTDVTKLFDSSEYDRSTGKLKLVLTEEASRAINEKSGEDGFYGKDFSVRLKVKVTNTTNDNIPDLMANKAQVTFVYGEKDGQKLVSKTNFVHTKVRDNTTTIEFEKVDGMGNPLAGVEFKLYDEQGDGKPIATAKSTKNGQVKFDREVGPGKYIIKETQALEGYVAIEDLKVTVDQNLNVIITDKNDNKIEKNKVKNHLVPFRLELIKLDSFGNDLANVEFTLSNGNDTYKATSGEKGKITFTEDLKPGTYTLTETKTVNGYTGSGNKWEIIIGEDKTARMAGENLSVSYDKEAGRWLITANDEIGKIENTIKPFELSILKTDEVTNGKLADATFELFAADDTEFKNPLAKATTNGDGQATFKNKDDVYELKAGETYYVKETSAPTGYILLKEPFKITISQDGTVAIEYAEKAIAKDDFNWKLIEGEDQNNTIELMAKNTPEGSLPTTGGQGIKKFMTFSLVALALVGGLGAFYVYRNKKGGA